MYFHCVPAKESSTVLRAERKRWPRFIVRPLQAEIKRGRLPASGQVGGVTDCRCRFKASVRESVFPATTTRVERRGRLLDSTGHKATAGQTEGQTWRRDCGKVPTELTHAEFQLAKAKLLFFSRPGVSSIPVTWHATTTWDLLSGAAPF